MFIGTLVNAAAIALGSLIGTLSKKHFPENIKKIIFTGLGLSTMALSVTLIIKADNFLIIIFSIIIGAVTGELLKLQTLLDNFGDWIKSKSKSSNENFTEGMVNSSLIFCVGAMAIVGSFNEGLSGNHTLLFTKSILDGFASLALGATYGGGVFFSIIPLIVYQGLLTLLSGSLHSVLNSIVISQITATGGVLVMAIGLNLLEIKKIKTMNFVPSLIFVIIFSLIFKS